MGLVVSSSKARETWWENLIADKWLSMVTDRNFFVSKAYYVLKRMPHVGRRTTATM